MLPSSLSPVLPFGTLQVVRQASCPSEQHLGDDILRLCYRDVDFHILALHYLLGGVRKEIATSSVPSQMRC